MTYRCKNTCRFDGVCSNYQGHKELQGQRLKERFKTKFQTRNKTRLCDSKTKTQELKTKTRNV